MARVSNYFIKAGISAVSRTALITYVIRRWK